MYSPRTIKNVVRTLARQIENTYSDEPLVAVCVLKGAVHFFSDLMLALNRDVQYSFIQTKSYEGKMLVSQFISSGQDEYTHKHVLIVEDILDTGGTIELLKNFLREKEPLSIKVATLFARHNQEAEFVGIRLEHDKWVIGYGLDLDGKGRNREMVEYV